MDAHLTSNLKPCPFCGCNDIEGPFPHNQLRLVWVTRCGNPSCEAEHMADSAEETCARWNRRTTQEARGPLTTLQKERNYKTHKTRMSDASSFDEICTECGATDFPGSDLLDLPCPKAAPPHEPLAKRCWWPECKETAGDALCDATRRALAESGGYGVLDDGFGNVWPLCPPPCGLEIVRPGKVQCDLCQYGRPGSSSGEGR